MLFSVLYLMFVIKLNVDIADVVLQLKSDAREPFEKLNCSAVVKNVRIIVGLHCTGVIIKNGNILQPANTQRCVVYFACRPVCSQSAA